MLCEELKMKRILKKCILLVALFSILLLPAAVFADEVTEVWSRVYFNAQTLHQKYEIMLNIIELDNRDIIPLLMDALEELSEQMLYFDKQDMVIQNNLKVLIISELGDLKAKEAAPVIFKIMKETKDPFLKGGALLALGKTGAKEYAQEIAIILRNTSLYRGDNLAGEEAIAFGCITALERLKDPVGYLPVFLALNAGFSRKIQKAADEALPNILKDPTEVLLGLVRDESSVQLKLAALKAENQSAAPVENKVKVATEAINQGLYYSTSDIKDITLLRELRFLALEMFINYETAYREAVPLIEKVLYLNHDMSETVYACEALSAMPDKEAVEALTRFLGYQNNRQLSGIRPEDNRVVIATIRAIKNAKSKADSEELLRAKYAGYPAVVGREADKALRSL
jgi:HEAT repeat protein